MVFSMKVIFGISHRQELDPDPARTATITSGHNETTKLWGEILGHEKTMMVWTPVSTYFAFFFGVALMKSVYDFIIQ